MRSATLLCLLVATGCRAGEYPRVVRCWRGSTPAVDGVLSPGEWDDAAAISGRDWIPQFTPTTDPADLSLRGWVKHDGRDLYFAFEVTDDLLYGIETERWLPEENPAAHELTREGYPWFGDEMELLINAANTWEQRDGQNCPGDGSAWQMVCNLTKSRLGGVGVGGLLEGEPRAVESAWNNYQRWILDRSMEAAARVKPDQSGYVIEWRIQPDPCLEVAPGRFWSPALGTVRMGLNLAVGDLDDKPTGAGNFGNFHHEDWWAGEKDKRTWLKQWGTLVVEPGPPPGRQVAVGSSSDGRTARLLVGLLALACLCIYPSRTLCGSFEQASREFLAVDLSDLKPVRELEDAWGHRYLIGADTFVIDHPSGERVIYDRRSGLPFGHLTCLAAAPGGDIWIGSALGLLRFDAGRFEVYAGPRWLPDDRVRRVIVEHDGSILADTAGGVSRIFLRPMTLTDKAAHYEALTDARHRRFGYVTGCTLDQPGDLTAWHHDIDDNDGLWTAMYLAGEAFRYAVTGDEEARAKALESLDALLELERKTPLPGFPARAVCHRTETEFGNHPGGEWHRTDDGEWEWKADTSSDELDGHYFAWGIAYDLVAGPEEQAAIAEVCARVTDHLVENGYYLLDRDGLPTTWGVFSPERLNTDPRWFPERGLNSLELLSYLKTAAHVTGDVRYEQDAADLVVLHHYALNTVVQKVMPGDFAGAQCNHSDDELAFLSYYNLLRYETDAALRSLYVASLERSWRFEEPERCPLWNFIYGGLTGRACDVDGALATLREIPLDLVDYPVRNSHRWDIALSETPDRFDRPEATVPLSFRERPLHKWNGNPYRVDGGGGRSEECGTFWLLAYWLGRYHRIIDEA